MVVIQSYNKNIKKSEKKGKRNNNKKQKQKNETEKKTYLEIKLNIRKKSKNTYFFKNQIVVLPEK